MVKTSKQEIKTDKAPKIPGPLCQGIKAGNLIFISCAPLDMKGKPVTGDFKKAAKQMMENTKNILEAANSSMERIVRVDAYLQDMSNFETFNKVYREYIPEPFPARSISQPQRTPLDLVCAMVVTALAD